MQFQSLRLVVLSTLLIGGIVFGIAIQSSADKVTTIPVEVPKTTHARHIKSSMSSKRRGVQLVLDGLIQRDFSAIKKGASTLRTSGLANRHIHRIDDREDKIYEHFRLEFMRLTSKLDQMAKTENIEGTAYVYQNLTANCVACHDHMRDVPRRNHK